MSAEDELKTGAAPDGDDDADDGEGGEMPDMAGLEAMMGGMGGKGGGKDGGMGGMDMNALMAMLGKGGDGGKGGGMGGMMGGMGGGKGGGKGGGQEAPEDDSEKVDEKWVWNQKGEEVHIRFKLDPPATAKKDVEVKFKATALVVKVRGETIIDGAIGGKVEADECTWCFSPLKDELMVMLTKVEGKHEAWANLLA